MAQRTAYHCHRCGAGCYRRVIERASDGAMRASDRFRCTGCDLVFADRREWHDGLAATAGRCPATLPTGAAHGGGP